jgi:hypothetical protein
MGLNSNHTVEELGGQRCAIVEKNITQERADFLTKLLAGNGFTVVCAEAAPPKAAKAAAPAADAEASAEAPNAPAPEVGNAPVLFSLGVTDVKFNPINAIYGRILTTEKGHFVTPDYWQQKDPISHDEIPYYEKRSS